MQSIPDELKKTILCLLDMATKDEDEQKCNHCLQGKFRRCAERCLLDILSLPVEGKREEISELELKLRPRIPLKYDCIDDLLTKYGMPTPDEVAQQIRYELRI